MRDFLKLLPLGVGLPVVIGAASVGPGDAASNISKWVSLLGWHNLPIWLTDRLADKRAIAVALAISAAYTSVFILLPRIRNRLNARLGTQGAARKVLLQIGIFGSALLFVCLMTAFFWPIKASEDVPAGSSSNESGNILAVDQKPSTAVPQVGPMFSASESSTISARDLKILSDIRGISIASATKNSSVTIDGMVIGNSSDLSFPAPVATFDSKTNSDLKAAAKALAEQFREAFNVYEKGINRLRSEGKPLDDSGSVSKAERERFEADFRPLALALSGAILYRVPSGHTPSFNLTPNYLEGVPHPVRRGMRVLLMGGLYAGEGEVVAEFLKNIADRLPS